MYMGLILGQIRGTEFILTDPDDEWTDQVFAELEGVIKSGSGWQINCDGPIYEWVNTHPVDGGFWVMSDLGITLLRTVDIGTVKPIISQQFKRGRILAKPFLWGVPKWVKVVAYDNPLNPIGQAIDIYETTTEFVNSVGSSEGCGNKWTAWAIPDGDYLSYLLTIGKLQNFGKACENHDRCYSICEKTKNECEREFWEDLEAACKRTYLTKMNPLYAVCGNNALAYATAVSLFGDSSYNDKPHVETFWLDSFFADQTNLTPGSCTQLRWNIKNGKDGYITNDQQSSYELFDNNKTSAQVCPQITTTYTINAADCAGNIDDDHIRSVTINVQQREISVPLHIDFWADAYNLHPGECTTVHWIVAGATWVTYMNSPADTNGSAQVCPETTQDYFIGAGRSGQDGSQGDMQVITINVEASQDRCSLFDDIEMKITYLDWVSGAPLEFYFKMPGGIPGLEKSIAGDTGDWEYIAKIGDYTSSNCDIIQGYGERLYCTISLPSGYSNALRPLSLMVNGCGFPVYTDQTAFLPEIEGASSASSGGGGDGGGDSGDGGGSGDDVCGPEPPDSGSPEWSDWCGCRHDNSLDC